MSKSNDESFYPPKFRFIKTSNKILETTKLEFLLFFGRRKSSPTSILFQPKSLGWTEKMPETHQIEILGWSKKGDPYLEDHPRTCKWLVTLIYKPWNGHLEGEQPQLGDSLLTSPGMILQV